MENKDEFVKYWERQAVKHFLLCNIVYPLIWVGIAVLLLFGVNAIFGSGVISTVVFWIVLFYCLLSFWHIARTIFFVIHALCTK